MLANIPLFMTGVKSLPSVTCISLSLSLCNQVLANIPLFMTYALA